ncbi:MAG: N-acetylmuramoyl-L-alanine amidase, partial [Duodenibacillus sp.]
ETLVVVIDAGHGGEDPGAVGRGKTREKDVVLAIAKKLEAHINRTRGMRAVMTRTKDVFLPLHKRAETAVKNKAHLFISIHADAWTNTDAQGSSVYILSTGEATSLQARWLAQTQNKADEIGGVSFKGIDKSAHAALIDLQADAKLRDSTRFADKLLAELSKVGPLHKSSIEQAEFAVLKARGIASVLVETAFISNPKEENKLRDARQQARMAKALLDGVRAFWKQYPNITKTL